MAEIDQGQAAAATAQASEPSTLDQSKLNAGDLTADFVQPLTLTVRPTTGRIVNYNDVSHGNVAAIVTSVIESDVEPPCLKLTVFPPDNTPYPIHAAPYSAQALPGCWSWPVMSSFSAR
jgi:hypothetical protein